MLNPEWRKASHSFSNGNCLEARWAKSSRSAFNGNCLQARWRKASHSESGNCAEARTTGGMVQVRDSKLGDGSPVLSFSPAEWTAFLASVKAG